MKRSTDCTNCWSNSNNESSNEESEEDDIDSRDVLHRYEQWKNQRAHIHSQDRKPFSKEKSDEDVIDGGNAPLRYQQFKNSKVHIHTQNFKVFPKSKLPPINKKQGNLDANKRQSTLRNIIILTIFMIVAYTCHQSFWKSFQVTNRDTPPNRLEKQQNIIYSSVLKIRDKFPTQKTEVWDEIIFGIYDIVLNPEQPSVLIFYATESNTMNCLAKHVAQTSNVILNGSQYLSFNPEDLGYNTEKIINKFKGQVLTQKAVVFENLLNIQPPAFRAFHNLFDRYNPLIKGVVYIATILIEKFPAPGLELSFLENEIRNLYSKSIESDVLNALVARITDSRILSINSEKNMPQC